MHLDNLTRLIEGATFSEFRDIALEYLKLRGYSDIDLKDGWGDGGSDFVVGRYGANSPLPMAIQVSVQRRDWNSKVLADAKRAKHELGLETFLYVTSRRLPAVSLANIQDVLRADEDIAMQAVDSQAIASTFFENAETSRLLGLLGIPVSDRVPRAADQPRSLKADAAFSFAFFGDAATDFRRKIVEQSVMALLSSPQGEGGLDRESAIAGTATVLGLGEGQEEMVRGALDRMLQRGDVKVIEGHLRLAPTLVDAARAARALRERRWRDLQTMLYSVLVDHGGLRGRSLESASEAVSTAAGTLVMQSAASAEKALSAADTGPAHVQLRKGIQKLEASLGACGVPSENRPALIRELAEAVASAEISRELLAGELFMSLTRMKTSQLLQALGGSGGMDVYLDASVAIPILVGLLYETGSQRYFRAAGIAYEHLKRHGSRLIVPMDYVEEAASHLVTAYDRYRPLIGRDADLRFSTNAFVAHYVDLSERGRTQVNFERYAQTFGLTIREAPFVKRRNEVMAKMVELFGIYGVTTERLPVPASAMKDAESSISFTAAELNITRDPLLLKHDARTVAHMSSAESDSLSRVLCTWDKLHLNLRGVSGGQAFQALDPAMLSDLLSLARGDESVPLLSGLTIALELDEEAGQRGADVLDGLVRIEEDGLHDAERLHLAQKFKVSYIEKLQSTGRPDDLARAWASSKEDALRNK